MEWGSCSSITPSLLVAQVICNLHSWSSPSLSCFQCIPTQNYMAARKKNLFLLPWMILFLSPLPKFLTLSWASSLAFSPQPEISVQKPLGACCAGTGTAALPPTQILWLLLSQGLKTTGMNCFYQKSAWTRHWEQERRTCPGKMDAGATEQEDSSLSLRKSASILVSLNGPGRYL